MAPGHDDKSGQKRGLGLEVGCGNLHALGGGVCMDFRVSQELSGDKPPAALFRKVLLEAVFAEVSRIRQAIGGKEASRKLTLDRELQQARIYEGGNVFAKAFISYAEPAKLVNLLTVEFLRNAEDFSSALTEAVKSGRFTQSLQEQLRAHLPEYEPISVAYQELLETNRDQATQG